MNFAQGGSNLFRSLAAGCLQRAPCNQNNYMRKIICWINKNLLVSWVCMDDGLRLEKALIVSQQPLLNIQGNPCKLAELTELRKKCRLFAID